MLLLQNVGWVQAGGSRHDRKTNRSTRKCSLEKKHIVLILVLEPGFPSVGLILDVIVTAAYIIARTQTMLQIPVAVPSRSFKALLYGA